MTIWILHQQLSPDEEATIRERAELVLPFEGLPDLSLVKSPAQALQLLKVLHPGDPPETLTRRLDKFWNQYYGMHKEDIITVPLKARGEVVIATVSGSYRYRVGGQGEDIHLVPVTWYEVRVPLQKFKKHKDMFVERSEKLLEVTDAESRIAIRDWLPHSYNRFSRWKWILVFFFVLNLISMMVRR